jgi:twitching motility protein PilT
VSDPRKPSNRPAQPSPLPREERLGGVREERVGPIREERVGAVREERSSSTRNERVGPIREERLGGGREERAAPVREERLGGGRDERAVSVREERLGGGRGERLGGGREERGMPLRGERLGTVRTERTDPPLVGQRTAIVAEEVVVRRNREIPSGAALPPVQPSEAPEPARARPRPLSTQPAPPESDPPIARALPAIAAPAATPTMSSVPVVAPAPSPPVVAVKPVLPTTAPGTPGQNRIDRFLRLMNDRGASDLHLSVGRPPIFRLSGRMEPIRYRTLDRTDFVQLLEPIAPAHLWADFVESGDCDFAYEIPGVSRFRVNLFRQERGDAAVLRIIPTKLMTVAQLGLPESIRKIVHLRSGLVLVTGPTGSGKSTTLSAIINEMNATRPMHFVTIEDPIEFVHPNKKSLMSQREVGPHSKSFSTALRAAVREDPDAILVGEMRDLETISMALNAAETGVLVFGTLHTNSAAKTIDRVVNVFPADRQPGVRGTLASVLKGVVAQQLLRKKKGGRCAAVEILFGSNAMASMIRDGKSHQISGLIKLGKKEGMIAMDDALKALVEDDSIEPLAGLEKSIDKDDFRKWLKERGVQAPDDAH